MKKRIHERSALLALGLVLIGLSLSCVWWVRKEQRQHALNRQLIAAIEHQEFKQAIVLVEAGANPNTREDLHPVPSLSKLMERWLHRSEPSSNDSPTALIMVCQSDWNYKSVSIVQLATAMLHHGGNVNAKDAAGMTALHWAVLGKNITLIKLLLIYKADPVGVVVFVDWNRPDIAALLRKYSKRPLIATFTPHVLLGVLGISALSMKVMNGRTKRRRIRASSGE